MYDLGLIKIFKDYPLIFNGHSKFFGNLLITITNSHYTGRPLVFTSATLQLTLAAIQYQRALLKMALAVQPFPHVRTGGFLLMQLKCGKCNTATTGNQKEQKTQYLEIGQ